MRGAAWVLVCPMVAVFACARRAPDLVDLAGARSIVFEGSTPIYELDRAAPLRLRLHRDAPLEARLSHGGITRVLRPVSTSASGWAEYALTGVPDGRAELEAGGERFQVSIGDEAQLSDLLGFRAIAEGEHGLERELDAGALPYFRVPSKELADRPLKNAVLTTTAASFLLPIISAEPIDDGWAIVRTGAPESPIAGRGELRLGDRVWRAAWIEPRASTDAKRLAEAGDREGLERLASSAQGRAKLEAMVALSAVVRRQDDGPAFARALRATAEVALEAGVPSEATRMWRAAAYAHLYARTFAEVEPLLARAEALDQRLGNMSGLVRADYYRVVFATELGRYRSARQTIARAEARAKRSALDADRALLASSSAMLFLHLGRHEEALAALAGVEAHFMAQHPINRALYLLDLGWTELKAIEGGVLLSPDRPRRHLEDALALARDEKAHADAANAIANLLWLAYLERDRAASERWMKALAEQPHLDSSFSRPFLHFARASLALSDGRFDVAQTELVELRRLAELEAPDGSSEYLWRAAYGLGRVCRARGDRACARARYAQAIEELERVSTGTDLGRSRAPFLQDRRSLFDDAIALAIDSGRTFEVLVLADRARTGVLRALESTVRSEALDPARVAEYLSLRDRYELRKKQAELQAPAMRARFDAETVRMRGVLQQLFEAAYERSTAAKYAGFSSADLARALGAGDRMVVFARVFDRTDAFVVTQKKITHHRDASVAILWPSPPEHLYVVPGGHVGIPDVLGALAKDPALLERTTVSFLTHAGGVVRESPAVRGDPSGSLSGSPAAVGDANDPLSGSRAGGALEELVRASPAVGGDANGSFSGEPAAVGDANDPLSGSRADGAIEELVRASPVVGGDASGSLSGLRETGDATGSRISTTSRGAVVVADPDGTLPAARAEGRWVGEVLGVSVIAGESASRRAVLEAIGGASVFHFAGHGVLETARPWDAHLSLAGGQTLSLEDLLIARPAIGVVVLSGCSTGASAPLAANERIGLTDAFLFAGARALVATIGDVEDAKAASFVRRFYGAGGHQRPVEAWRDAALASHRAGDDSWTRFYVLGRRHDGVE